MVVADSDKYTSTVVADNDNHMVDKVTHTIAVYNSCFLFI